MCIAILNTKGAIKDEYLKNSWDNNNQGGGLLYVKNNKLIVFKSYDYNEFKKEYKTIRKDEKVKNIVLHFRIATSGHEKYINLHPFLVNDNLGFVHNGIISGLGNNQHSDTYQFNEMLKKLPSDFLKNNSIVDLISGYIDSSKLIFLDNLNNFTIINENYGMWESGNWYSNNSHQQNLDFYYFGNEKVSKKKTKFKYFSEDEILEELSEEMFFYNNATKENIFKLCDLTETNTNDAQDIKNLIHELSYTFDTIDINYMIEELNKEYYQDDNDNNFNTLLNY